MKSAMEKAMRATLSFAVRQLGTRFVVGAVEFHGTDFRVWTASGPETTIQQIEAVAHNLLEHVAREATESTCSECVACRTRFARVTAALAALQQPDRIADEVIAGPTSEARH